jgi:hypothetical protein
MVRQICLFKFSRAAARLAPVYLRGAFRLALPVFANNQIKKKGPPCGSPVSFHIKAEAPMIRR